MANGHDDLSRADEPVVLYGEGNLGQFGWNGTECIRFLEIGMGMGHRDRHIPLAVEPVVLEDYEDGRRFGQYGWGGLESFPIPGDYDGDGVMEGAFYRPAENWWFIEGWNPTSFGAFMGL